MPRFLDKRYIFSEQGDHEVDFESVRDDIDADPEFHAYMTFRGLYVIVRITVPLGPITTTEYHVALNSVADFETAFTGRAALNYVRFDLIYSTFFG